MVDLLHPTDFDLIFDFGLDAPGINPFSARGLKGTLGPVDEARGRDKMARNVNGALVDLSAPQMRKYKLSIKGNDQAPPALDGLWVGMPVVVFSLVEIGARVGSTPTRPWTPDGIRFEGEYFYYRQLFQMRVVDWNIDRDEYAADVPWTLELEEN